MKKLYIIFTLALLVPSFLLAQVEVNEQGKEKKENKNRSLLGYWTAQGATPARTPYASGYLIDNQTNTIPTAKTLVFVIQHRFGSMKNGISDLWGIYGTANTRLGLNYSLTDWLQVGIGTTKNYKVQDIGWKVNILHQSRDEQVPLAITYYGNWSIEARDKKFYGTNFSGTDRFAFFNELLLTRKFADWFTFSIGGSFTHFNKLDSLMDHDRFGLHFLGRFSVSPQSSILINYDLPLDIKGMAEWADWQNPVGAAKPNFGIAWEICTSTHSFQIFLSSGNYLVPQYNMTYNENNAFGKNSVFFQNIFFGFNITRLWSF